MRKNAELREIHQKEQEDKMKKFLQAEENKRKEIEALNIKKAHEQQMLLRKRQQRRLAEKT